MRKIGSLSLAITLAGCAANPGVTPLGPDTFLVSRQAANALAGAGTLKADALQEAGQYCAINGKSLLVTNATEAQPPYILGNYPKAEVQFMCLAASDPRMTRSAIVR